MNILMPKKVVYLSVDRYVKEIVNTQNNNIEHVVFIPPVIGSSGFGEFKVTYKNPVLVRTNG